MDKFTRVVGAIIFNNGKLLVQEHAKTGMLTIPVGACEEGEAPHDALYRELQEELGVSKLGQVKFICKHTREGLKVKDETFNVREYIFKVELNEQWENMEPLKHPWMGELTLKQILHHPLEKTEALKQALRICGV